MKKYSYLIVIVLISSLVLTGCSLLSNVGQVPTTGQIAYLTKGPSPYLVGLWHLDSDALESSGTTPPNNGTVYGGAGYSPSPMGQALSFDGIGNYVEVAQADSLDMTGAYTIEAWVNVTDVPENIYRPILFRGATDANDIEVYVQAVSNDLIVAHNRGNGGTFDYVGFDDPPIGQWFHLAVTFDGTDVQAYYGGTPASVSKETTAMTAPLDTDKAWWIGKVDHTAFGTLVGGNDINLFKGLIDEIRIWNVVLSQGQLGDVTPPVVTITAPAPGCYKEIALPLLAYDVVEANSYTVEETGWLTTEGVHTVTVTATDDAGNIGSASVTYTVDNTKPEVTITAPVDGGFYPVVAVPALEYTVTDNLDPAPDEDVSGYSAAPGEQTVTVTATDCAGNVGSDSVTYYVLENFVTGGGKINIPGGKKAAWTFAGTVGNLEEGSVGQFQIVDHINKIAYHCSNNFSYLVFSGGAAQSPIASHNTAEFTGTFTNNRDTNTVDITVIIQDLGEPGAGTDKIEISGDISVSPIIISGGNFQVHNIE